MLTAQQQAALTHGSGPARIIAGAGTGKTTVMVGRFHHLVEQGARPERILALTFSREAARSMRDAILPEIPAAARLYISTFHSFCLKVLAEEGLDGVRLIYEPERQAMLRAIGDGQTWSYYQGARRRALANEALHFIGQAKDFLLTPGDVAAYAATMADSRLADLAEVYRLYQVELQQQGAAEYADFIVQAVDLLQTRPGVAAKWQERFDHILVDEFQDTNLAQFRVLQVLAERHGNLVVVGDDDQAIYRFRGASERYLVAFERFYPNQSTYKVEENFRCPQPVLDVANPLIERNQNRIAKQLRTTTKVDGYPAVELWSARTAGEEADAIAAAIGVRLGAGAQPEEFAILCRSLRRLGGELTRALRERGIPFRLVGEEGLHPVARQTLSLLRLALGESSQDLVTVLASKLAPTELHAALRQGALAPTPELADWLAAHRDKPVDELVYEALLYLGHLRLSLAPTAADLERLGAARDLQHLAAQSPDLATFLAAAAGGTGGGGAQGAGVTLMTIHAAKGLQFPVVFVPGWAEDIFPVAVDQAPIFYTAEAIRDWLDGGGTGDVPDAAERLAQHLREERRLAYVALTRASCALILSYAHQYGADPYEPSQFLGEMQAPEAVPVGAQQASPLPDARSYLLAVAAGVEEPDPERLEAAVGLLASAPEAVPLRRQAPPAPFAGDETLRLSATALESYRECPRRYYYGQVLRFPDEDNIALAFGDAVHNTLERYHRALQAGQAPTWDDLAAWWQQQLEADRCAIAGQYRQLLEQGRIMLQRYFDWAKDRWQEIIIAEDRFEIPYIDGAGRTHKLVGRYDLIARDRDGVVHIIDFKTGHRKGATTVNKRPTKSSPNNPDQKLQLGLYYQAHLGGAVDPAVRVTYVFLRHPDDKYPATFVESFDLKGEQVIGCSHTSESLAAIRAKTDEVIAGVLANRFDRTTDESKCRYCSYKDVCEVSPLDWF